MSKATHRPGARLTRDQVREIRERFVENDDLTKAALADGYDTTEQNIRKIVTGRSWKDVGGPRTESQERAGPPCKLTNEEAWNIRWEYETTDKSQQQIADEHEKDISQMAVSRVVNFEVHTEAPTTSDYPLVEGDGGGE